MASKKNNQNIKLIQTPQGFRFQTIFEAHKNALIVNAKDDSSLIEEKKINFNNQKWTLMDISKSSLEPVISPGPPHELSPLISEPITIL